MLFSKLTSQTGTPLFTKLNAITGSPAFRKGYNTLDKIGQGLNKFSSYANSLAPAISSYNPVLGGITSSVGQVSPLISKSLHSIVNSAKNVKRIEKGKPIKNYY
jgi:hypothetical protein